MQQNSSVDELLLKLEHDVLREPGVHYVHPPGDGNFADHVMYYVNGLKRRKLRLRQLRANVNGPGLFVQFECATNSIRYGHPPDVQTAIREWAKARHAAGMFELAEFKQGRDKLAYEMALFVVTHVELLNFQPEVFGNPDHEQNRCPLIDGITRDGAYFHLNISNEGVLVSPTRTPTNGRFLQAAASVRNFLLNSGDLIASCEIRSSSAGIDLCRFSFTRGWIASAKPMFLRDLETSAYISWDGDRFMAMAMGLHPRLGENSVVRQLSGDALALVMQLFSNDRLQQFKRLLLPSQ